VLNSRNGRTAAEGWRVITPVDASISVDQDMLQLRRVPGTGQPLADKWGTFGGLSTPSALAIDASDRIYILDPAKGEIKRFDPCRCEFEVLACIGGIGSEPRQLRDPKSLAVSPQGDLVVADTGNRRLQVFSLKELALRKVISRKWEPHDVVFSRGSLYVSDFENGRIHRFDCHYMWQAEYDGKDGNQPALEHPTHLAADREGRIYVVQDGKSSVVVLDADGKFIEAIETTDSASDRFCPARIALDENGNLYVTDRESSFLRACYCAPGGEARAIRSCSVQARAASMVFDRDGNLLMCDSEGARVLSSALQGVFAENGTIYCGPLDSGIYRCAWDRIALVASIAPGTEMSVRTLTTDGDQLPTPIAQIPADRWRTHQTLAAVGSRPWDCLVLSPPGRYLWISLSFSGEKTATPRIREIRVFFPRMSSLRYLPAAYSEDPVSRDFLDRFLSIFDSIHGQTEARISDVASYWNPMSTPAITDLRGADFLAWLASWMELPLDQHWSIEKRRTLLKNAHRLYALRGTPEGLRLHIRLYMESEPQLLEHFKLRRWLFLNHARLGDDASVWGNAIARRLQLDEYSRIGDFQLIDSGDPVSDPFGYDAHRFTVSVPLCRQANRDLQQRTLERIIEMGKPAHTEGFLHLIEPRFRLGVQSFIGIDTVVGEYPSGVTVGGEEKLGMDTVLGPSSDEAMPPHMRVGVRSRIGTSTQID
jgi:phage tail-like protein